MTRTPTEFNSDTRTASERVDELYKHGEFIKHAEIKDLLLEELERQGEGMLRIIDEYVIATKRQPNIFNLEDLYKAQRALLDNNLK